jgi:hypothetical protein
MLKTLQRISEKEAKRQYDSKSNFEELLILTEKEMRQAAEWGWSKRYIYISRSSSYTYKAQKDTEYYNVEAAMEVADILKKRGLLIKESYGFLPMLEVCWDSRRVGPDAPWYTRFNDYLHGWRRK